MIVLAFTLAIAGASVPARVAEVAAKAGFAGEILVGRGDRVILDRGYGTVAPIAGGRRHRAGATWRLASITKQVTATLLLRTHATDLDKPMIPPAPNLTLRQLLTHHSGLANPDTTPAGADGVPAFYRQTPPDYGFCLSKLAKPGSEFSYNNCDYLVADFAFEGMLEWPAGMRMARGGEMGVAGFVAGKPEPHYELASFGAAGGLMGSARAVFNFDRKLMTGKLLSPAARAELWKPEGGRSYQALGQWVFPGQVNGCASPKRIVQRDGEIGGVQTRNYILPDDDLAVVVFTNRGPDDFAIGEIWQGKGFAYDLLSAVACS
ncbi:serine hydrolase domain-containing protein [Sphingomonas sp. RB1R13]|uniref:serine hydrolase domain-containing protein n=1 Tax=Sphingomonas sp. RB1R13 TaxID=3096159 RepID=UPI002FCBDF4D